MADREQARWSAVYQGAEYFYGEDAGPLARRAVRYHRPLWRAGSTPTALDVGCGEGQDVAFLSATGYEATGLDFIESAVLKAQRLLVDRGLDANIISTDLLQWNSSEQYDLVLACNSLQFLGAAAPEVLERVIAATAADGVLGLSLFACESNSGKDEEIRDGVYFTSLDRLMVRFDCRSQNRAWQMLETTRLWQWNARHNAPQPFVTLIAQRLI